VIFTFRSSRVARDAYPARMKKPCNDGTFVVGAAGIEPATSPV
jgi:hypothetical protein